MNKDEGSGIQLTSKIDTTSTTHLKTSQSRLLLRIQNKLKINKPLNQGDGMKSNLLLLLGAMLNLKSKNQKLRNIRTHTTELNATSKGATIEWEKKKKNRSSEQNTKIIIYRKTNTTLR